MKQKKIKRDRPKTVTIRGLVEILNGDGGLFDAVLVTDNDEEFYISVPGGKINPADYADEYVLITGVIYEREGYMNIAARNISVVEAMDDYNGFGGQDEWFSEDYIDDEFDDYKWSSGQSGGMGFSGDY